MHKYIDEVSLHDKTILLRVDFNVPLTDKGTVADDARIKYALPTITELLKNNNRLILISHLGKPKNKESIFSLKPVVDALHSLLPDFTIHLIDTLDLLASPFADREIKFLENIRFWPEEKACDPAFTQKLASFADAYVTDAFSVCHRKDASVVGVPRLLPSYGGFQLKREITMLDKVLHNPQKPFTAVLGGSKISTKLPLLQKLVLTADSILIGGGMASTFLKAKGLKVGKSLIEETELTHAKALLSDYEAKLRLPTDAIIGNPEDIDAPSVTKPVTNVSDTEAIYDIGPETIRSFSRVLDTAHTVIWNGPVGYFEKLQYRRGTDAIYDAIVKNSAAFTVLGGGDTLSAIKDKPDHEAINHISTGGGAMLTYLADGSLPGIDALNESRTAS